MLCELTVYAIMSEWFKAFQYSCEKFVAFKPGNVKGKLIRKFMHA